MQPSQDNRVKATDPSKTTLFIVDSAGEDTNGVMQVQGLAYNRKDDEYQYMTVEMASKQDATDFYNEIYPEKGKDFAKLQANTQQRKTKFDYGIEGIISSSIDNGVKWAKKYNEPLSVHASGDHRETMLNEIDGRYFVYFDNLKVTGEKDIGNDQKVMRGTATRMMAASPISDTRKTAIVSGLGYIDYTPADYAKNGIDDVKLMMIEDNTTLSFAQLQSDKDSQRFDNVVKSGLQPTMSNLAMPDADRNGSLELYISYKGDNDKQPYALEFSIKPEIDREEQSQSKDTKRLPRESLDVTMSKIMSGDDYHSRMYKQDPNNPKIKFSEVVKHDVARLILSASADYDKTMAGDFVQVANHSNNNSPQSQHYNALLDKIRNNPAGVMISAQSKSKHILGRRLEENMLSSKNYEYLNLKEKFDQKNEGESPLVGKHVVNSSMSHIASVSSMLMSNFPDENGKPVIDNIVHPIEMSFYLADNGSTPIVNSARGTTAYIPYPDTDNNGKYTSNAETFFNNRPLPHDATKKFLTIINTTYGEIDNPINNNNLLKQQKAALQQLHPIFKDSSQKGQALAAIPKVDQPYYFNPAVDRDAVNTLHRSPDVNGGLTDKQVNRVAVLLGNYLNPNKTHDIESTFNTDYRRDRMDEFISDMNNFHPNYFMNKATARAEGYGDLLAGGFAVVRDLVKNPSPDKIDVMGEYADMVEICLRKHTTDKELLMKFAPEPVREPQTLHSAIPDIKKDSITNEVDAFYNGYHHSNQPDIKEALGLKDEVVNSTTTASQPRLR